MKVSDAMTKAPVYCNLDTNLGVAVELMWAQNCGILPVVDSNRKVLGVITDRDIAIAMGTKNRLPAAIKVAEAATRQVQTCKPTDDIHLAIDTIAENKVRRLIVVNEQNQLEGILSMDDVVLSSGSKTGVKPDLSSDDVVRTLKTLYSPQLIAQAARA